VSSQDVRIFKVKRDLSLELPNTVTLLDLPSNGKPGASAFAPVISLREVEMHLSN
jgi:hypothetical protein